MKKALNLLHDPWILVTDKQGKAQLKSILDVLSEASDLKALSGETGVQDVAILRLLLGVLYPVFTRRDTNGQLLDDDSNMKKLWKTLWEAGKFPVEVIKDYILQYEDRFWLIHPEYPFWQTTVFPDDDTPKTSKGVVITPSTTDLVRFVGDVANTGNIFGSRRQVESVPLAEAARWLIYHNAYDISFSGGGVTKMKGYRQPWPAYMCTTWVQGANLFETLMLNLVLEYNQEAWDDSPAWWELSYPCQKGEDLEKTTSPVPSGITELMSKQYRYSRLIVNDELTAVVGWKLWSGVKFTQKGMKADAVLLDVPVEQMTPWSSLAKKSSASKKIGNFEPVIGHSTQMWRDLASLLTVSADANALPGVIIWLGSLKSVVNLPMLRIGVSMVIYKEATAVKNIFTDVLSVNASIIQSMKTNWQDRIPAELKVTESMVSFYGVLATDIAAARGIVKAKPDSAHEEAYYRLDIPFRAWLASIDANDISSMEAKCQEWRDTVKTVLLELGKAFVSTAGTQAYIGRSVTRTKKEGKRFYSSAKAYGEFKKRLSGGKVNE